MSPTNGPNVPTKHLWEINELDGIAQLCASEKLYVSMTGWNEGEDVGSFAGTEVRRLDVGTRQRVFRTC